jgi:uncharacterized membrane protein SpoIIM required for sporulation
VSEAGRVLPPIERFYGRWHMPLLSSMLAAFLGVTLGFGVWGLLLWAVVLAQGALLGYAVGVHQGARLTAPASTPPPGPTA